MQAALVNNECIQNNDCDQNDELAFYWWAEFSKNLLANIGEEITLDDLAKFSGLSKFGLIRAFRKKFNMPPMRWLWRIRAILARELLVMSKNWSLTDIAFMCGFTSSSHFSRFMKTEFNVSPKILKSHSKVGDGVNDLFELTNFIFSNVIKMAA